MSLGTKRSASPLPLHLDNVRKVKLTGQKKDKSRTYAATPATDHIRPKHGQEVVSLSPFFPQATKHENVNDIILQTAARLAREGKRLTRAPQLLPDGIAFDWVSDLTAQGDDLKKLLSVQGIRSADLDRVLSRAAPHALRASTLEPPKAHPPPTAEHRSNASAPPASQSLPGNASNPIVIDDDPPCDTEMSSGSSDVVLTEMIATENLSSTNTAPSTSTSPRSAPSRCSRGVASPQRDVSGPSRLSCYVSGISQRSRTPEPLDENVSEEGLPFTTSDDRASVVTYASPAPSNRANEANRDRVDPHAPCEPTPRKTSNKHNGPCLDDSPGSIRDPGRPSERQLEKRRADYGNWQSLAVESSEAEMDDERPSSRGSSPDRAFPPQSQGRPPGLGFLPQTYDVSGLVDHQTPASGSRSEISSDVEPPPDKRCSSSPEHTRGKPSVGRRHTIRNAEDLRSDPEATSGPPDRSVRRRKRRSNHQSSTGSHDGLDDQRMDIDVADHIVRRDAPSPQPPFLSGNRHPLDRDVPPGASKSRRNTSKSHYESVSSARRAPSSPVVDAMSDSEQEDRELTEQTGPDGHTVVVPKAEFARGRRLLAPKDQDLPLATILMRGDAHFIDQRRKARLTRWSLPAGIEGDSRHVEDACLIGDGTVVVGYNKGPCQVSLIPVRGDQRPRRIDLTYRAHSTVIENRSAGTSYPNPGIACLASVTSDSFLSGGHDKTVRHWTVTRNDGQSALRAAFSARSVRIPTGHLQSVQALAFSAWNDTVYSASGDFIATTPLGAHGPAQPVRVSGKVAQVHVHPQDPRIIALEIDHMDEQVQLYDTREGGFGRKPWLKFGYRAAPPRPRASAARPAGAITVPRLGSRYIRGSTVNSLFARGYPDGVVLVWDYRNGAQKKVIERFRFQRPSEIVHTVLTGGDVVAYGGYSVTFWSMLGG